MRNGIVYTETVIYSAPEAFAGEAPYQTAIISLEQGGRVTVRVQGERVAIGDAVVEVEARGGAPFFQSASSAAGTGQEARLTGTPER
jgi:uncharacterized OB-fold protein